MSVFFVQSSAKLLNSSSVCTATVQRDRRGIILYSNLAICRARALLFMRVTRGITEGCQVLRPAPIDWLFFPFLAAANNRIFDVCCSHSRNVKHSVYMSTYLSKTQEDGRRRYCLQGGVNVCAAVSVQVKCFLLFGEQTEVYIGDIKDVRNARH